MHIPNKRYIYILDGAVDMWDDSFELLKARIGESGFIYELKYKVDVPAPVPTVTEIRHPQPEFNDDDIPF
jgi:hypothetical protein